jgi:hypothetical protein
MAEESVFRGVLEFFNRLGLYDVVLPFLLVFSILFAILERTKVLGTEKTDGPKGGDVSTKKNLNAMVAFVGAFFVIASARLVAILHETLATVALLLLVLICFLLLIGTFHSEKEEVLLKGAWKSMMMVIMFVAMILIFMHAIKMDDGQPFLFYAYDYLKANFDSTAVSAIILAIIVIGLMAWITKGEKQGSQSKD